MFSIANEHISAATRLSNAMARLLSLIPQSSQHQQLTLDTIGWHNMNVREKLEKIFDILIKHFTIIEPDDLTEFFTDIKLLITLGSSDRADALNILQVESVDKRLKSEASAINLLIDQTRATVIDEAPLSPPEMCEELIMYAIEVSQRVAGERASGRPSRYTDYVISYLKNLCRVLLAILESTFPERLVRQPVVVRSFSSPTIRGQMRTVNPFSQFQSQMPQPASAAAAASADTLTRWATLVQQPQQSQQYATLVQQRIPAAAAGIGWGPLVPGRPHAQLGLPAAVPLPAPQPPAPVPLPAPQPPAPQPPAPQPPAPQPPAPQPPAPQPQPPIHLETEAEAEAREAKAAAIDIANAEIDAQCIICHGELGNIVVRILPCEHFRFHPRCLADWMNHRRGLGRLPNCPLCETVIDYTVEIPFAPPRQQAEQPEQPQSRLSSILRWLTRAEGRHTKHRRRSQNCDGRFCSSKKKRKGHRGRAHKRIITEKQNKKHNITKHRKKI